MIQKVFDSAVLSFFSLLYSGAVMLLKFRTSRSQPGHLNTFERANHDLKRA